MDTWFYLGPLAMLAIALGGYFWLRRESASLDRRFGRDPR